MPMQKPIGKGSKFGSGNRTAKLVTFESECEEVVQGHAVLEAVDSVVHVTDEGGVVVHVKVDERGVGDRGVAAS